MIQISEPITLEKLLPEIETADRLKFRSMDPIFK